jgi:hypothetical protein
MPRLPELPDAHYVNPQHCEACKVHAILRGLPRHRANRPADAPSQNPRAHLNDDYTPDGYPGRLAQHTANRP